jgi:hypothetical protein
MAKAAVFAVREDLRPMATQSDHSRLIAEAAREALQPLGLIRKGRSRTWLDDNDWWLAVVEFQPSSWARGSYVNVGAMWLWRNTNERHIYFGIGHRIDGVGFADASDAGFAAEIAAMADAARQHVRSLRAQLPTVEAAAAVLREKAIRERGWAMWDAAVALGLSGNQDESAAMFGEVAQDRDDREWWVPVKQNAAELADLVRDDAARFSAEVQTWIARYRQALKL